MNTTIKGFIQKEFIQVLRDKRMRAFLFVAPILQLLLFGYAITNEVRNIRLATAYQPGDVLAQQIEERCYASGWFLPVKGEDDPFTMVQSGKAEVVLVAPPGGLTKAVRSGGGELQVLLDATNMIRARGIEQYVQAVVLKVLAEEYPDQNLQPSLQVDMRILYNPEMKTSYYLVPGVMVMLLCILTIIMTSMSIVKEREAGTFETLVTAPIHNWEILLGKTVPFVVLALIQVTLILVAAVLIFGLPMHGPLWKFYLAAFVFICATVSVGTMISTIARTQQQAMMGSFMFMFPGILLSGLMFPLENMPKIIMGIAYINPLKYFLALLRNVLLKGGDDWVFWTNLSAMVILAVIAMAFSFNRFKQTLN
jgi:drug efflux transport system permease protein